LFKGFINGQLQPSIYLDFTLPLIHPVNFEALDDQLKSILQIEIQDYRGIELSTFNDAEKNIALYVWRVAHIGRSILQAIKIPCIDRGLIQSVKINSKQNGYIVGIFVPIMDEKSLDKLMEAYKISFRLLEKLCDKHLKKSELEAFYENIQKKFIEASEKQMPGGKSTVPMLITAYKKRIPFMHLDSGIYQLGWGCNSRLFDRSSVCFDSAIGSRISHNKYLSTHIFRTAGLPVPKNILVNSIQQATEAASNIGYPVVIKPCDSDRGEGITVNIYTAEMVAAAYEKAAKVSKNILVEKSISGVCHRILIVEGSSPYTVKRLPQSITGDGVNTIQKLIKLADDAENIKIKYKRMTPLVADDLAIQTLNAQDLHLQSVPEPGKNVYLRPIESSEWGGTPEIVTDSIHPENIRIAVKAAELLNLKVAGVDFISEDASVPWYLNGAAINEINYSPLMTVRLEYQKRGMEILLEKLVPSSGRIPIEAFIGDESALKKALSRQKTWLKKETHVF
jgi:cyanophycin synthetase